MDIIVSPAPAYSVLASLSTDLPALMQHLYDAATEPAILYQNIAAVSYDVKRYLFFFQKRHCLRDLLVIFRQAQYVCRPPNLKVVCKRMGSFSKIFRAGNTARSLCKTAAWIISSRLLNQRKVTNVFHFILHGFMVYCKRCAAIVRHRQTPDA